MTPGPLFTSSHVTLPLVSTGHYIAGCSDGGDSLTEAALVTAQTGPAWLASADCTLSCTLQTPISIAESPDTGDYDGRNTFSDMFWEVILGVGSHKDFFWDTL